MGRHSKVHKMHLRSQEWKEGKNHHFNAGDVVTFVSSPETSLGVIMYPKAEIEEYAVRWWMGPKPWDVLEGSSVGAQLQKTDKPNPMKYSWSERVPGPSSTQIDALNAKMDAARAKRKPIKDAAKEADVLQEALEEEMTKKDKFEKLVKEGKVDSIVDDTLEEDNELPVSEIEEKIEKINESDVI